MNRILRLKTYCPSRGLSLAVAIVTSFTFGLTLFDAHASLDCALEFQKLNPLPEKPWLRQKLEEWMPSLKAQTEEVKTVYSRTSPSFSELLESAVRSPEKEKALSLAERRAISTYLIQRYWYQSRLLSTRRWLFNVRSIRPTEIVRRWMAVNHAVGTRLPLEHLVRDSKFPSFFGSVWSPHGSVRDFAKLLVDYGTSSRYLELLELREAQLRAELTKPLQDRLKDRIARLSLEYELQRVQILRETIQHPPETWKQEFSQALSTRRPNIQQRLLFEILPAGVRTVENLSIGLLEFAAAASIVNYYVASEVTNEEVDEDGKPVRTHSTLPPSDLSQPWKKITNATEEVTLELEPRQQVSEWFRAFNEGKINLDTLRNLLRTNGMAADFPDLFRTNTIKR